MRRAWLQAQSWLTLTIINRVVSASVFSDEDGKIIMPGNFIEITEASSIASPAAT